MTAVPITEPLRCALYARISNDPTGRQAGVDRQQDECRRLVERLGWEVTEVLIDNDVSAFNGSRRAGYERLLRLIEADQIDAVVAYHPDRLYRRPVDLLRLIAAVEGHRIEVRTTAAGDLDLSTATGRAVAQTVAVWSEHEAARIGERVKLAFAESARKGRAHGGPAPYGYRRTGIGALEVDPEQAEVIRDCAARLLAGETQRAIVIGLNDRGVPPPRSGQWTRSTVRKMLYSPRIAGLVPAGDSRGADALWPPIVDRATWERLHALLDNAKRGRKATTTLLAGFLRCERCQGPMVGHDSGDGRRDYRCSSERTDRCPRINTISAVGTEREVVARVLEAARGANLAVVKAERMVGDTQRLTLEVAEDEAAIDQIAEDFGARRISRSEWLAFRAQREPRLRENRAALARMGGDDPLPADLVAIDAEGWEALTFDQRRALIALFVPPHGVVVTPHRPGAQKRFDPLRLRIPTWVR